MQDAAPAAGDGSQADSSGDDGKASQPPAEEMPPILDLKAIQRLEVIGEGATAMVYRCIFEGQVVAVKELDCHPSSMTQKGRVNLSRELKILHKVQHDHLVQFLGVAVSGCKLNIVMEYCDGGTIFDLVHNSDVVLTWPQKLNMSKDVSSAMHYLHSFTPQIIHRDLKSLNLLLHETVVSSESPTFVKVADFGQSRTMGSLQTAAGATVMTKNTGTAQWMAPEVFQTDAYDAKVDVYSFSMILYELICGEIPFEEVQHMQKLGLLVCKGQRPKLAAVPATCPHEFSEIMIRCWDMSPAARPTFDVIHGLLERVPIPK
jgi:serine/threonine-protein kinase TNNI3K